MSDKTDLIELASALQAALDGAKTRYFGNRTRLLNSFIIALGAEIQHLWALSDDDPSGGDYKQAQERCEKATRAANEPASDAAFGRIVTLTNASISALKELQEHANGELVASLPVVTSSTTADQALSRMEIMGRSGVLLRDGDAYKVFSLTQVASAIAAAAATGMPKAKIAALLPSTRISLRGAPAVAFRASMVMPGDGDTWDANRESAVSFASRYEAEVIGPASMLADYFHAPSICFCTCGRFHTKLLVETHISVCPQGQPFDCASGGEM